MTNSFPEGELLYARFKRRILSPPIKKFPSILVTLVTDIESTSLSLGIIEILKSSDVIGFVASSLLNNASSKYRSQYESSNAKVLLFICGGT